MNLRFAAVFLIFCAFAVTGAEAKPRTTPDTVTAVGVGMFTLKTIGPATLSGIWQPKDAPLGLEAGQAVEVKSLEKDRYGRTPVLLYKAGASTTLQEQLIAEGHAMVHDRAVTPASWRQQEDMARKAKRGLWATPPLTTENIGQHLGQMVRVRGKVARTYKSRTAHYINFREDWKKDFSISIPRKAWRAFGKDFEVPDGACVEARGYAYLDNGPMIEVMRPEQLEIRDANTCRG